jgi:acylglycerol lipase
MTRSPDVASRDPAPRRSRRWRIAAAAPLALLAPLLLLATCGPPAGTAIHFARVMAPPAVEAAVPAQVTPRFTEDAFIASDGTRLPLRKWLPKGPVNAVILALHGFNDYSNGFDIPAKLWAARGIATYAYDQRGFGGAPGRGLWAGEGRLALDAIVASRILRRTYPGRKLILLGESMGGAVAVLAATGVMTGVIPGPDGVPVADADAVVLSAPAVWGRATMDFLPRLALFAGVRLFPDMTLTGRGLQIKASDNLPMLRALARDPFVLKGARIDTMYGLVDLMGDALAAAPRLGLPLLLMYGAHDQLVPRNAMAAFTARLPPAAGDRRRLAYYPKGYHLLLRDLDGEGVAADVASWIADPTAPLPSRADAAGARTGWPPAPPDSE